MSALGIIVHDGSRIIDSNAVFCRKSGYYLSELIGSNPLDLVAPEFRGIVWQKINSASEDAYLTTGIASDGSSVLVEVLPKTITHQGMVLKVVVVSEASGSTGNQSIDADFLRNLVHGLRAPLHNLSIALQMMRLDVPQEQQQRYYELAIGECDREIEIIDDFLKLIRIQSGSYEPNFELINLIAWLSERLQPFELRAQQQGLRLSLVILPDVPALMTDPLLLKQIVEELVTNACKYTAAGGEIQLRVQLIEQTIELTVCNTAQIPEAVVDRLFDSFYRYWQRNSFDPGGSGLGLTAVRRMVQTLQGDVSITSQAGWTSVQVLLPILNAESDGYRETTSSE